MRIGNENIEEIMNQRPMTYKEAMEWMAEDIYNIAIYNNVKFFVDFVGDLCEDGKVDYEEVVANVNLLEQEWYKVNKEENND